MDFLSPGGFACDYRSERERKLPGQSDRQIQIFFYLTESGRLAPLLGKIVFEIVGTGGCIESRKRSGDRLRPLNRTILACVG